VRQPLRRLAVAGLTEKERERIGEVLDLVRDELNVREIVFPRDRGDLLQVAVKPNYPVLGKKAGAAMKELASKVQSAPPDEVRAKVAGGGWEVEAGGQRFTLTQEVVPRVPGNGPSEEWTFDGERARVGIERVHKGG